MHINDAAKQTAMKVDSTQRSWVRSVEENVWQEALENGNHYIVSSGYLTLTSANESSVVFLENGEDRDILIDRFVINSTDSTGGTEDYFKMTLYKNADSLDAGGGNGIITNTNLGSSNTLTASTVTRGAEAASFTGGSIHGNLYHENPTLAKSFPARILVPKGSSFGVAITPPAGNTSLLVAVALNAFLLPNV